MPLRHAYLRLVHVARGGGVPEEQRERETLVYVLRCGGVGVDDLQPDLVRVLVEPVVIAEVRSRVGKPDRSCLPCELIGDTIGWIELVEWLM